MGKAFQIHGITEKYREKSRNGDHILYREIEQEGIVLALAADGVSNSPYGGIYTLLYICRLFPLQWQERPPFLPK